MQCVMFLINTTVTIDACFCAWNNSDWHEGWYITLPPFLISKSGKIVTLCVYYLPLLYCTMSSYYLERNPCIDQLNNNNKKNLFFTRKRSIVVKTDFFLNFFKLDCFYRLCFWKWHFNVLNICILRSSVSYTIWLLPLSREE
jgi:hypothetical protein